MPFESFFFSIALGFDILGLFMVIFSGLFMLWQFFCFPKVKKTFSLSQKNYHFVQNIFVHRIILSLDFFIVADLIKLAFADGIESLIQILLIVVIRGIFSYYLLREGKRWP